MSLIAIDRWLERVIRKHADALIFKVGQRPWFYIAGRSEFTDSSESTADDIAYLVTNLMPAMTEAQSKSSLHKIHFNYGQIAQFEMILEHQTDGDRLTFWNRGAVPS